MSNNIEQAHRLQQVHGSRPVKVIAVTSGKGGVGKTNVSVNLATALANLGRQVMLLDADLGLANVDVVLGLQTSANLSNVLNGECPLQDIIVRGPNGIQIVPGASGVTRMADLSEMEHAGLIRAFSELSQPVDVLVVDTPAGISKDVMSYCRASQEVIVVVCNEPASMTDAYALIKVLHREHGIDHFQILVNRVRDEHEGHDLYRKMSAVCGRFLDVVLKYIGVIPEDSMLRQAVKRQGSVVDLYPGSSSGKAFKHLARLADNLPVDTSAQGHLAFFVERLLGSATHTRTLWGD